MRVSDDAPIVLSSLLAYPHACCSPARLSPAVSLAWGGIRPPGWDVAPFSLQIVFPAHVLDGFSCHEEEVRASYKYKHLKAAFTNVAQKEPWSAKVGLGPWGALATGQRSQTAL